MAIKNWLTQLQDNGYRLTGVWRAVVEIIADSHRALTPVEVTMRRVINIPPSDWSLFIARWKSWKNLA